MNCPEQMLLSNKRSQNFCSKQQEKTNIAVEIAFIREMEMEIKSPSRSRPRSPAC